MQGQREAPPDGPAGLLYHISGRCRLCGPSALPDEIPAPNLAVWVFEPVAAVKGELEAVGLQGEVEEAEDFDFEREASNAECDFHVSP